MRLIDVDALGVGRCSRDILPASYCAGWNGLVNLIEQAPTIDAVPVIRCKDCKHWKKGDFMGGDTPDNLEYGGGCPLVRFARYESDFCSKGERREDYE